MNFVNFLACDVLESADANNKLLEVIKIARTCVQIMQVVVPAAVIIWGSLDFFKSVIAGNEKEIQEKRKPFIQRVVSGIILFLIPWFVGWVIGAVSGPEWKQCWNDAKTYQSQSN